MPFKIEWFIYAQTVAYATSALLALIIGHNVIGKAKVKFKKLFSIVILRNAFPYALLILLMMIYNRMDSVMLERIHPNGALESGIYAQGFRLLDAINMFALLFAGLLLPIAARMLSQKQSIHELVENAGLLLLIPAIIFGVSAYFYATEIIQWRYHENILASSRAFKFLILSFIPIALTYIYGTLLTANGSLLRLNQMAIAGLSLNFILNWVLIPKYGAEGAAVATLSTQWFTAIIQIVLAYTILKLRFTVPSLIKTMSFATLFIFASFFTHLFMPNLIFWIVLMLSGLILSAILGVLPLKKSFKLLTDR
jgi:O-antigen/teichoic acid export membrane protein